MDRPKISIRDLYCVTSWNTNQSAPLSVTFDVSQKAYDQGRKPEVVARLGRYGTITLDNRYSRVIGFQPMKDKLAELVEAYNNGDLDDVDFCPPGQPRESCSIDRMVA